jgi:hemerythrin
MAFINWDESLSVNVREIDEQHKKLVGMINKLHSAMIEGKGNDILDNIISEMVNYVKIHFFTEEKYFDMFHYEEAEPHKVEHAFFTQKVEEFKEGFEKGLMYVTLDVLNFLTNWLTTHLMGCDKKYVKCFNENGLY